MTPDQTANMRRQLADYSKGELMDLNISLQDVIEEHLNEKRGMASSIAAMSAQLPALQAKVDEYEGTTPADPEELEALQQQVAVLNTRVHDLTMLNEGLTKKLIG